MVTSSADASVRVKGYTAYDKAKVRKGPKFNDDKVGNLSAGQEVIVTGYTIDPNGGSYKRRYRIEFDGQDAWIAAKLIGLESPASAHKIPFVPFDLANPVEDLISSLGIILKDIALTLDDACALACLLPMADLRGEFGPDELAELRQIVEYLDSLGVALTVEENGRWSLDELRAVHEAVSDMANGTARILRESTSVEDDLLGFRLLYAPLLISRDPRDSVSPKPAEIWFAKNSNGYEITLGNRVFFKGMTKTRTNPDLPYSSKELIAHEIAHTINWRYPRHIHKGRVALPELDVYYEKRLATPKDAYVLASGEKALFSRINDGYAMAARSSNGSHETVTDAIACLTLDRFTIDSTDTKKQLLGKARREQIGKLMTDVIRYRVNDYGGGVEALKEEIARRWGASVLGKMSPMLGTLSAEPDSVDSQIEMLKEKLASPGGTTGQ